MTIREKTLIGAAVLVLVSGIVAYYQFQGELDSDLASRTPAASLKSIEPTGSARNAVNDALEDMTLEESLAAEVDDDGNLLTNDSQEINAISQTYAESEF